MHLKKWLLASAALLCAAMALFAGYSYRAITAVVPVLEQSDSLPVIVIDAGHGGFDGGAVGVDGVVEKGINLAIAQKLYDLFTVNGFKVVMTRGEDESLEDEGLDTIRKRKNSDIHNRKALAESFDNSILLSIHQNQFTQSKYYGAQVFYGPKNEQSAVLGEIMQRRMTQMLQPENTRQMKPCGDSVYLIYHAKMPALLIECGFLSNPEESRKLTDPEYQRRVAFAIFAATAESLGLEAEAEAPPAQESSSEGN